MPPDYERMAEIVASAIDTATAPLLARIDALERQKVFELAARLDAVAHRVEDIKGITGADGAPGVDGKDGADGAHGQDGANGADGKDGRDGQDGKSVTVEDIRGLVDLEITKGILDLERRNADSLQRVIDRMPVPKDGKDGTHGEKGADGKDGLGWEDFRWDHDEDGRLLATYQRGDAVATAAVPGFVYRGLFVEGTPYKRGDSVTWGGGQFIALKDHDGSVKPDQTVKERVWQLSVMRGRQGEKGMKGDKGLDGLNGKDGGTRDRY